MYTVGKKKSSAMQWKISLSIQERMPLKCHVQLEVIALPLIGQQPQNSLTLALGHPYC